jgi:REP element-mobilizing transposase RayT
MPSTHLSLHYHVVFSTKDRRRTILPAWRARLHGYLGGIVQNLGGIPQAIGGTEDHIHLLLGLRATHCLADVVRDLKANSSGWVHEEMGERLFAWQEGYGGFTVGAQLTAQVCEYIAKQEEHHRRRSFQEEYVDFLKRGMVEFDERFLW